MKKNPSIPIVSMLFAPLPASAACTIIGSLFRPHGSHRSFSTANRVFIVSEPSYAIRAAALLETILEQFEGIEALEDLDMDIIDGVLNVEFEDGSKIIINRQEPVKQIWVASPLGPAHFNYDATQERWCNDRDGTPLVTTLEQILENKMGRPIPLTGGF